MDQNKFVNAYIETTINSLIENIKLNLQLQAQIKVIESVIGEKDQVINTLNQQLSENIEAADWKVKYENAETNYNAILGKLKHMDTLLTQVNDMKNIILEKDKQIEQLKSEIVLLNTPKEAKEKVINTKQSKKVVEQKIDDF